MNTGNSDQEEVIGNLVTNFLVPPVLIKSCLAGMCCETTHMTTTEVKPKKKKQFYQNQNKNISSVGSWDSLNFHDIRQMKEQVTIYLFILFYFFFF